MDQSNITSLPKCPVCNKYQTLPLIMLVNNDQVCIDCEREIRDAITKNNPFK